MPPAVAAAAIGGAAALGSGVIQSRSANRALKSQEAANTEALTYQKELEARRRFEYDQQQQQLKAAWDAEQARLAPYRAAAAEVMRRRGFGGFTGATASREMPPGWTPGAPASTVGMPQSAPSMSLATMYGGGDRPSAAASEPVMAPPKLSASTAYDWSKIYG